jgi:signal transduction histidine kinase
MSHFPPPDSERWRGMRRRVFWRMGVLIGLILLISVCAGTFLFLLFATYQGWIEPELWRPTMPQSPNSPIFPGPMPRTRNFFPWFGICWPIGIILFIIGIVRLVRRIALPIGDLIVAAGQVQAGDYSVRVAERGPREVRDLSRAFNAMTTRLQANTEQRRAMLADISHELRTPLAVIQGNVEGLLDGIYARDDAHLQPILDETKVMSRLIEDLRTLALTEAGTLVLQCEPTDLAALAADVVSSFRPQADRLGIRLILDEKTSESFKPSQVSYMANVDAVRIREVITNLVSNALRYTPGGGRVTVSTQRIDDEIMLRVQDTGRGIAPELLTHVFDRFTKSRDSMGSGLGLAIAKQLVEAHGGRIYAESVVGVGTTVGFGLGAG